MDIQAASQESQVQEKSNEQNLYISTMGSVKYIFKNGKEATFVNGMYYTDIDWEIAELDAEVNSRHPHITVDPNRRTVDPATLDPLEAVRRQAVADYIARQKAAIDPTNDMGTSKQAAGFTGTTSRDIADGAASSDSGAVSGTQAAVNVAVPVNSGNVALANLKNIAARAGK